MIKIPINFQQTSDLVRFVQITERLDCSADLVSGSRMVDAKSLMGVLAISQASDISLVVYDHSEESLPKLLESFRDFIPAGKRQMAALIA